MKPFSFSDLPAIPAALVKLNRHLPLPLTSIPFAAGLEIARRLQWLTPPPELDGRRFAITVNDLGLKVAFCCVHGSFRPLFKGEAELSLSAGRADFLALLRGEADADTLFFQRKLKIEGDTELGVIVKNWLDATERPSWLQAQHSPPQT